MRKYFEGERGRERQGSFSDEENTESYDESLAPPPSPPLPPCGLEELSDYLYDKTDGKSHSFFWQLITIVAIGSFIYFLK